MSLNTTLNELIVSLDTSKQLVYDANNWKNLDWSRIPLPTGTTGFTKRHEDLIVQIAFLRGFISWETFLEESFILYLLGMSSPKGTSATRFAMPPDRERAEKLVAEGKQFADWTTTDSIIQKAERFFDNGIPFSGPLKSKNSTLSEIKIIRNAVTHSSKHCQEQFRKLVRSKLPVYTPGLTVGDFLSMTIPHSSPPESFLEKYISELIFVAEQIVPT